MDNKIMLIDQVGTSIIKMLDDFYKTIKDCELTEDIRNVIKNYIGCKDINVIIPRTNEEKEIDRKILNYIKCYIKNNIDNKNIIKYINNAKNYNNLIENYSTYKMLIDKLGIRQKMTDDVCYKLTDYDICTIYKEFKLRTNVCIIGVLNSIYNEYK